jgi:O-antigen ligase
VTVLSLLLGGGTHSGFLGDVILQLAALPLLVAALWRMCSLPSVKRLRWALRGCLATVSLPLIQLIPLPAEIWTALPNREPLIEAFTLLGSGTPWMPLSVTPHATWLAALSMLPPLALFLGVALLDHRQRRLLSLALAGTGILSVFVALMQVAQGPESPLRFFEITNRSEAVGFFANRNHFAALLYSLILFAAAWAINAAAVIRAALGRQMFETAPIVALMAAFTVLVIILAAQTMTRSRAGLGLTVIALSGAFALPLPERRSTASVGTAAKLLTAASAVAVMFAIQYSLYPILERFASEPLADARISFARNTVEAARAYMPFGSGIASFVTVYGLFEKPEDTLINAYANHAHNDLLELWLESGVLGAGLTAVFLFWLTLRSLAVWRRAPSGTHEIDIYLPRVATMVIGLLIVHSFVDYPIFACALLFEPLALAEN